MRIVKAVVVLAVFLISTLLIDPWSDRAFSSIFEALETVHEAAKRAGIYSGDFDYAWSLSRTAFTVGKLLEATIPIAMIIAVIVAALMRGVRPD